MKALFVDLKAVATPQFPVEGLESDDRGRTAASTACHLILPPCRLHVSSCHLTRQQVTQYI